MASGNARTGKIRHKATGRVYWIQRRIGFNGLEYSFGGAWRPSVQAAFDAAEASGALSEVTEPSS